MIPCVGLETSHSGWRGSQDISCVGILKGVGRIYQQIYFGIYSKVNHCKCYNPKTSITVADLLNDKEPSFDEANVLALLRTLTVIGKECCGKFERHVPQPYLAIKDIE